MDNLQHVFKRQWLEVQTIRRVIVSRDCLRVAIDHDGLKPVFTQCQGRMHAAVVELNPLTNPVWTATKHHDLALVSGLGFTFLFIRRVHVSRVGCKFSRASVHALVDRAHAMVMTQLAYLSFRGV